MRHRTAIKLSILLVGTLCFFQCDFKDDNLIQPNREKELIVDEYPISTQQATEIAYNFVTNHSSSTPLRSEGIKVNLLTTDKVLFQQDELKSDLPQMADPAFYIFDIQDSAEDKPTGFVIVSGTEAAYPVLAYSFDNHFEIDQPLDCGLGQMLTQYRDQIAEARIKKLGVAKATSLLRSGERGDVIVEPLLKEIKWAESPYYNDHCPPGTSVGSVAIAMCQIMKYWEYPSRGEGYHGYTNAKFGYLDFNFDYPIDWSNMPAETLETPNEEVARFCYGVGVSINTDYGFGGLAWPSSAKWSLSSFYRYAATAEWLQKRDMDDLEWEKILKDELLAGRPMLYSITCLGTGFVCDGFDSQNFFHFNYGRGGSGDSYCQLDAMGSCDLHNVVIQIVPPNRIKGDNTTGIDPVDDTPEPSFSPHYSPVDVTHPSVLFIRYIKLNNFEYRSSFSGYADYSYYGVVVTPGSDLNIKVDPILGFDNGPATLDGWVDWNQNGIFDSDECLFSKEIVSAIEFSTALPTTIKKGKYRFRIRLHRDGAALPTAPLTFGEVEDYTLEVLN